MLKTSQVYRRLDAKFKIGGVDAADLMVVLLVAALMNLFFGRMSIGPIFIFGIPGALFLTLYFGKRGKPEGFLLHVIRYFTSSGELQAGEPAERN